nr:MAG TPA: hypothetical protein [Caudoviricetes sp.]
MIENIIMFSFTYLLSLNEIWFLSYKLLNNVY